jgi:hypothetical protein
MIVLSELGSGVRGSQGLDQGRSSGVVAGVAMTCRIAMVGQVLYYGRRWER